MTPYASFNRWFEAHVATWDAVVLDIDGTLIRGGCAMDGSTRLLSSIRARRLPFTLLTNDGSNSPAQKAVELRSSGVDVPPDRIVSTSHGLVELAGERNLRGRRVFVMGRLGSPCYAQAAGLVPVRDPGAISTCEAVIIGEEDYDWEPTINAVVNFLIEQPAAPLIVPNPDAYFAAGHGKIMLAAGAAEHCIRHVLHVYGTEIRPVHLGKPYQPIYVHNHKVLESICGRPIERGRVLMIGDSLEGDVGGAQTFGYRAALVLTGITRLPSVDAGPITPDYMFEGL